MATLHPTRVIALRALRQGSYLLTLERRVPFRPGQCVGLSTDPAIPPRSYSIASGPEDTGMDLLFDVVAGGLLTPRLAALGPGDRVLVSDPFGSFVDRPGVSLWVATGTGVAPFVSMARAGLTADKTLVHGSRRADGLYYRSLLTQALGGRYVPCCSAEHGPSVYPGRVTAYLAERAPEPGARHLLCGSAEMVVDVRDLLIARGVPYTRIEAEVYF